MYFEDRVLKMKDGELSEDEHDTEDEEEKSDASKKVKSKEEYILRYEQLCRGNSSKVQKCFSCSEHESHAKKNVSSDKVLYYIYTNEIPSELSGENLISSHVKTSLLLRLHNKSHLSHQKTI